MSNNFSNNNSANKLPPNAPRVIGQYEIRGILGRGGMATVYRAYQPALDREVAIKVVASNFVSDQGFIERFKREARAIASLRHPNILAIYDYGQDGETPYIVSELLDGQTLRDRLGQPMTPQVALPILQQIASALDYAAKKGIVHRDVKPSNILLDRDNRAVLSDFGIVKLMAEGGANLTATGFGVGTPEYMSPEQGSGEPLDARSDQYSLGIVLYEMLTGVTPFRADTPIAIVMGHVSRPLPDPRQYNQTLSPQVVSVLNKVLAKNRNDRYESGAEFATAFEQAARGVTAPTQPTKPFEGVDEAAYRTRIATGPRPDATQIGAPPPPSTQPTQVNPASYPPPITNDRTNLAPPPYVPASTNTQRYNPPPAVPPTYVPPSNNQPGNYPPPSNYGPGQNFTPPPPNNYNYNQSSAPPPRKSNRGLLIGGLVGAVVLIAAAILAIVLIAGGNKTNTTASASPSVGSATATPSSGTTQPNTTAAPNTTGPANTTAPINTTAPVNPTTAPVNPTTAINGTTAPVNTTAPIKTTVSVTTPPATTGSPTNPATTAATVNDPAAAKVKAATDKLFVSQTAGFKETADALRQIIKDNPTSWLAQRELGQTLYLWNNEAGEIDALKKAVELNPKDATSLAYLSLAYRDNYNASQSLAQAYNAVKLDPNNAVAQAALALAQEQNVDTKSAQDTIQTALKLDPDGFWPNWAANIIASYDDDGGDKAVEYLDKLIAKYPKFATLYSAKGATYYYTVGDSDQAKTWYDKALAIDNRYPYALVGRGWIAYDDNKTDEAISWFEKAVKANDSYSNAHTGLGFSYDAKNIEQAAIDQFNRAISINIQEHEAYNGLAALRVSRALKITDENLKASELREAIRNADLAIKYRPSYADAFYHRGDGYFYLKEYNNALAPFQKAVELRPNNLTYRGGLGYTYYNLKQYDKAQEQADFILSKDPNNKEGQSLRDDIKKAKK